MNVKASIEIPQFINSADLKTQKARDGFKAVSSGHITIGANKFDALFFSETKYSLGEEVEGELIGYIKYSDERYILLVAGETSFVEKWFDLPIEERYFILSRFGVDNPTVDSIGDKKSAEMFVQGH